MAEDDQSCDNSFHSAKSELSQILEENSKNGQHSTTSTQVPAMFKRKSSEEINSSQGEGLSVFNISSEHEDS